MWKQWQKLLLLIFLQGGSSKIIADSDCSHEIKRCLLLVSKTMTNLGSILKSRDITLQTNVHGVKAMVFPVVVWGCESWTIKKSKCWNCCFRIVMLEKTLESPLDFSEIKPVSPKGNQPWILIGRTDAEAPVFWAPEAKSQLIGKDFDAGKDWGQEKGITQDEVVEWHHWLNGHEFERTLGHSEGQGSLACSSPWGYKEWDMT